MSIAAKTFLIKDNIKTVVTNLMIVHSHYLSPFNGVIRGKRPFPVGKLPDLFITILLHFIHAPIPTTSATVHTEKNDIKKQHEPNKLYLDIYMPFCLTPTQHNDSIPFYIIVSFLVLIQCSISYSCTLSYNITCLFSSFSIHFFFHSIKHHYMFYL